MLSSQVCILDFDGALRRQKDLLKQHRPFVVDLERLGPKVRLWADKEGITAIRRSLDPQWRHAVTFLGSGDFHFVSALLLEQFTEPVTLIVFDHHPDWDTMPPRFGCGAWVSRALEMPNISKVMLIGMGSDDLAFPSILTGNLKGLRAGRVEIYPYDRAASFDWPLQDLSWKTLKNDPQAVFLAALDRIPTRQVYISVDKDCLNKESSVSNWEEGRLSLDQLVNMLATIRGRFDIVGMDVTGDHSPVEVAGYWKKLCSFIDHPRGPTTGDLTPEEISRINEETNLKILKAVLPLSC